jgi:hypothetical protein
MQIGDLVTLSAAGKKNKGNDLVIEKMGVILEIGGADYKFPYTIHWFNVPALGCSRGLLRMKRYEIKKV